MARCRVAVYEVASEPFVAWLEANGFSKCRSVRVRGAQVWKRVLARRVCEHTGSARVVLFVVPNRRPLNAASAAFQSSFRALAADLDIPPRALFLQIWPTVG